LAELAVDHLNQRVDFVIGSVPVLFPEVSNSSAACYVFDAVHIALSRVVRYAPVLVVLFGAAFLEARSAAPQRIERASVHVERPSAHQVVLISIDGLGAHVLERSHAPRLKQLASEGTALQAETVKPSRTLPSHFSMLSGLPPSVHGVLWNDYRPFVTIKVRTVFTYCKEARLRCGLFAGKDKFAHFAEHEPGVQHYECLGDSPNILSAALAYLSGSDPDLTVIHLPEVDQIGHEIGWGSATQLDAVRNIDHDLARFFDRLLPTRTRPLAVIVTADHGGFEHDHAEGPHQEMVVPWLIWDSAERHIPGAKGWPTIADTAPTVISLLGGSHLAGSPRATGRDLFAAP
jgi:predicted AlkP superfamily pyrophosphatase or phosphodiesterase